MSEEVRDGEEVITKLVQQLVDAQGKPLFRQKAHWILQALARQREAAALEEIHRSWQDFRHQLSIVECEEKYGYRTFSDWLRARAQQAREGGTEKEGGGG